MTLQYPILGYRATSSYPLLGYGPELLTARQHSRKLFLSLLRETRLEAGFTQVQLAKALGVPQSFISKCESGERRLDLLEVRLVCRARGVPLIQFVQRLEDILSTRRT